jgi:hypothetical protein
LFVEPVIPGHAPVASVYHPAPVFGGAWVNRPPPAACVPVLRNLAIVGITPWAAYLATRSCRSPSEVKKTALADVADPVAGAATTGAAIRPDSKAMVARAVIARARAREFTTTSPTVDTDGPGSSDIWARIPEGSVNVTVALSTAHKQPAW